MSKHDTDRKKLQEFIDRFNKLESEALILRLSKGQGNPFARQAINIILKERGAV